MKWVQSLIIESKRNSEWKKWRILKKSKIIWNVQTNLLNFIKPYVNYLIKYYHKIQS